MNRKKLIILIVIGIICSSIGIVIAIAVLNNKPKCPSGYKLSNDQCIKTVTTEPNKVKYCNNGYTLENDTCTKTEIVAPTIKYYCDNTYSKDDKITISESTLVGSKCSYTMSHEPVKKRTCTLGSVPYNDTQCRITIPTNAASRVDVRTGRIMYYCVGDSVLSGTQCLIYGYSDYVYEDICVEGYTLINGQCTKYFTYDAGWNATCPSDYTYVDKNTCIKEIKTKSEFFYECPSDYDLIDNICQKKIYTDKK